MKVYAQGRWTWMACYSTNDSNVGSFPPVQFEGEKNVENAFVLLYFYRLFGFQQRGASEIKYSNNEVLSSGFVGLLEMMKVGSYDPPRYPLSFISFLDKYVLPWILLNVRSLILQETSKNDIENQLLKSTLNLIKECKDHISNSATHNISHIDYSIKLSSPSTLQEEDPNNFSPNNLSAHPAFPLSTLQRFIELKTNYLSKFSTENKINILNPLEAHMLYFKNEELFGNLNRELNDFSVPELANEFQTVFIMNQQSIKYFARLVDLFALSIEDVDTRLMSSVKGQIFQKVPNTLTFSDFGIFEKTPLYINSKGLSYFYQQQTAPIKVVLEKYENAAIIESKNNLFFIKYSTSRDYYGTESHTFEIRMMDFNRIRVGYRPYLFDGITHYVKDGMYKGFIAFEGYDHLILLLCSKEYMKSVATSHKIKILLFDIYSIKSNNYNHNKTYIYEIWSCRSDEYEGRRTYFYMEACNMITSKQGWLLSSSIYSTKKVVEFRGTPNVMCKFAILEAFKLESPKPANPVEIRYFLPYCKGPSQQVFVKWMQPLPDNSISICLIQYFQSEQHIVAFHKEVFKPIAFNWSPSKPKLSLTTLKNTQSMHFNRNTAAVLCQNAQGQITVLKLRLI